MKFTTKLIILAAMAAVLVLIASRYNLVPGARVQEAAVPRSVEIAQDTGGTTTPEAAVDAVPLPTARPAPVRAPQIRLNVWEWNAQMGLFFANGGPQTTNGSLMEKHGVSVKIVRQDDTNKSQEMQVQFANVLVSDPNPSVGIHFVVIMGDQSAGYIASINKLTSKLGPEFRAEVVGAVGYSRGEDAWWTPPEWKGDAQLMKGKGTAGAIREGDWNITLFQLAASGIKNNPDETTWDMDAMNWFNADYLKAVEMYVKGYCEDRPVVANGKKTGATHHGCVDAYTTWTPGDVNGAKQKGGLIRLLSTAENIYQMPAVVIGIRKWNEAHAKQVTEFLAAALEGGDQVRHHEAALVRAGQASYAIYADQTAAYWVKYYRGVIEKDKMGVPVPLGGSTVMNLGDNLRLFGLAEDAGGLGNSAFNASYTGFGNLVVQQYPALLPGFPPVAEAMNPRFLQALAARAAPGAREAEVNKFEEAGPISAETRVAARDWNIQFDTGKASFTPAAEKVMSELYNQLVVGGGMAVEIQGHTDNVGNADANKVLSEARAFAVKQYLEAKNAALFPANRVVVRAFGDTLPKVSNATPEGRAQNRRVTIILGTKG